MSEIVEQFFTGYCKKNNSTQMISCEYTQDKDGYFSLDYVDCDFGHGNCTYSNECTVVKQALAKEDEEPA